MASSNWRAQPTGQVDVLRFSEGIAPSDIVVSRNGYDLVLAHVNGTDRVTLKSWYLSTGYQVERVEFADGSVWLAPQLNSWGLVVSGTVEADTLTGVNGSANTISGGDGNDTISGGDHADLLRGDAGNDVLNGNWGSDVLEGGDGNDVLDGGAGADVLRGGAGDDVLGGVFASSTNPFDSGIWSTGHVIAGTLGNTYEGGTGNDTLRGTLMADLYLFNLGDGADNLHEVFAPSGQPTGQVDVLRFGEGIAPSDIVVSRSGYDLVLAHVNSTDRVTVKSWYSSTAATKSSAWSLPTVRCG